MSKISVTRSSERGAILIHVGIGLIAILAFCAFVVDYGVMWVSRRQAQNAADGAALAGALALALDDPDDKSNGGPAKQSALQVGASHVIWGQPAGITLADITFPICPDGTDTCVRADVFRNQAHGNALPTFFGKLVGVSAQGVQATATAQAPVANASDCLKPWAIQDKWEENYPTPAEWSQNDIYETLTDTKGKKGGGPGKPDHYQRPTPEGPGTGFSLAKDLGRKLTLKWGNPDSAQPVAAGFFFPIDLPRVSGPIVGGDKYRENIYTCNSVPIGIGDTVQTENGAKIGPTTQGVSELIAQDPNAYWDPVEQKVKNSCMYNNPPCAPRSPRIISIPVFDTAAFERSRQTGKLDLVVVNILGFFIEHMQGDDVVGYFMRIPGVMKQGAGGISEESAFMHAVMLVQ